MKNIVIRQARPGDSSEIARVQVETWRTAYRGIIPDSYLNAMEIKKRAAKWHEGILGEPNRPLFVATIDSEVIGFISGSASREKVEFDGEITAFYVIDIYQGL